jgi:ParB family chromosome partitioning protein
MSQQTIAISQIDASDRLRPVDPLRVAAIAGSIEEKGLIQPMVVRPLGALTENGFAKYQLIAGGHRLAAVVDLGWTELELGKHVIVREEENDDEARLSEVFENLFRGELTALDRAIHLATAKTIHEKTRVEKRGRPRKDVEFKQEKNRPESGLISSERFTKEAAKRIGLGKTQIDEAIRIAEALKSTPDVVRDLHGTMIAENAQELKALAALDPDVRRNAVAAIRTGKAKTMAQARVVIGLEKQNKDDPQKRIYADLLDRWSKASNKTKRQFMVDVGLVYAEKGEKA